MLSSASSIPGKVVLAVMISSVSYSTRVISGAKYFSIYIHSFIDFILLFL